MILSGDILPIQQTSIYSRITGNIQNIFVDIGDYVHRGKLLAVIDKSQYIQSVKLTEGQLKQAKANLENNKINYERLFALFEKGLTSQGEIDNAYTLVKVSEAQVQTAEANYDNARIQLGYCNITAPFSGYITKRHLDRGALVSSSSQNSIFILSDISKLKIMVNVPEKNITMLNDIKTVQETTDAYPGQTFEAVFQQIAQSVDLATRTMQAEIHIDNKENSLKPGMFAKVKIDLETHYDVLILSEQCVRKDEKGEFVFVVNNENTAIKNYVQTGIVSENKKEIVSGIKENDKIISVGQELVREEGKVKIVN